MTKKSNNKTLQLLKRKNYNNLFIIVIFSFFPILNLSQSSVDELIKKSTSYAVSDKEKSLEYAEEAVKTAELSGSSDNKVRAYIFAGYANYNCSDFKKSLEHVNKGLREKSVKKNPMNYASLNYLAGANYAFYEMFELSSEKYKKCINILKNSTETGAAQLKVDSYLALRINGIYLKEIGKGKKREDLDIYLKKAQEIVDSKVPIGSATLNNYYMDKNYYHFDRKENDSALYFLNKSNELINRTKDWMMLPDLEYQYGNLYLHGFNNLEKAAEYFKKSLESGKKYNSFNLQRETNNYQNLYNIYKELKNNEKRLYYLELYNLYKNKQEGVLQDGRDIAIGNEIESKVQNEKGKSFYYFVLIGLCLVLLSVFLLIWLRRKNKRHLTVIDNKNSIIEKQEEYAEQLESKLKVNLEEVLDFAKNRPNEFYSKFQEYQPDFQSKLIIICPDLNISDLTLLAYIYLNFSTKEIGDYTFKSVRTIQTRKYHLRKKMGLESHDDFYFWTKNI